MSDAIISVENLGKRYSLRHQTGERYTALRDVIAQKAKSLFRRNGTSQFSAFSSQLSKEDFWALRNVSFEVQKGEVVGIIGRNGAGKSTLLKILSRITDPTEGRVRIRGRVASLLEVGTGFHPELTGRENIFLNGAILGMNRAEIKAKFDEIVSFAEVEKFLDTPVKRYSSGMYVRLAFAVAAHLEPEILVIDEVLAVGDVAFQRRCLGKMRQVSETHGRTVVFVSHNLAAISSMCGRCAYLEGGKLVFYGETERAVASYVADTASLRGQSAYRELGTQSRIRDVRIEPPHVISHGSVTIEVDFESDLEQTLSELCLLILTSSEFRVALIDLRCLSPLRFEQGSTTFSVSVPKLPLVEGSYSVGLWIDAPTVKGDFLNLATFDVLGYGGGTRFARYPARARGYLELQFDATVSHPSKGAIGS